MTSRTLLAAESPKCVRPRPVVLRLVDEDKAAGKKLAVCSAATKSSVILCLENLIGIVRLRRCSRVQNTEKYREKGRRRKKGKERESKGGLV
ncbi:haloacid dehalogenase-like hydrolase domain-containing protein At4g39970 isoform X2 [Malania oleifera]|uniref:haloacid dehalogenase-like hydrolase domain-containing protein At4g39970 isoform X2 n=1 Tax=Malania oleifera TaxID=397392 RepID=UPI0025ADC583|nr:haloacid dehalogenase-like hydrolase domain-containing protein At4g39970 isoform X2 [Malania oleifera]